MPGRQKGATNKAKRDFRKALRRYAADKNVDPHFWMVDLLKKPGVRMELKLQAAKELAQYLEPKLRAVEVSGDPDNPVVFAFQKRLTEAHERITNVRIAS